MAVLGTYTAGSTSDLNRARRALNDTGASSPWTFSDDEINDWITDRGSWEGAVAEGYRCLAGRVARNAQDYSSAQGSVNQTANYGLLKQQADDWDKRAEAASSTSAAATMPRAITGLLGPAPSDPNYRRY